MAEAHEILTRLRAVMARELETINEYEHYAAVTADPEIKALFQHLADEEKEHVTEVFEVLKKRDAVQAAWEQGAHVQAIRDDAFGAALAAGVAKAGPSLDPAEPAAPATAPNHPAPPVTAPATQAPDPVVRPPAAPARPVPALTIGSLFGLPQG